MASLRIHLDDAPEEAGPLLVACGTHSLGVVPERNIASTVDRSKIVVCTCAAGDAIVARPLLLHASRRSRTNANRRILHIEFADVELPAPLEWRPF